MSRKPCREQTKFASLWIPNVIHRLVWGAGKDIVIEVYAFCATIQIRGSALPKFVGYVIIVKVQFAKLYLLFFLDKAYTLLEKSLQIL